jgi:hypothetical protein
MYQGCRVCGQNVIHLDGKCNAVIHSGIRDSSYRPQENEAHGVKGDKSVLFEDNDWRGEAFHLPINIDESIFDGLNDITAPILPTATMLGETAIAVAASISMENTNGDTAMKDAIAEANEMFINMRITTSYVQVFYDEPEVSHAAGMETPQPQVKEEEQEEDALYARDLPTPNMAAWVFTDVRTGTTFTEFWETHLLHMKDTRAKIVIPLIEWRSLLGRTSHEGLLEQLLRYEALYRSINRAYILVAYGRVYRLVESARALIDRTDRYSFQDLQRHMWYAAFTPMEWYEMFTLLIDNTTDPPAWHDLTKPLEVSNT